MENKENKQQENKQQLQINRVVDDLLRTYRITAIHNGDHIEFHIERMLEDGSYVTAAPGEVTLMHEDSEGEVQDSPPTSPPSHPLPPSPLTSPNPSNSGGDDVKRGAFLLERIAQDHKFVMPRPVTRAAVPSFQGPVRAFPLSPPRPLSPPPPPPFHEEKFVDGQRWVRDQVNGPWCMSWPVVQPDPEDLETETEEERDEEEMKEAEN